MLPEEGQLSKKVSASGMRKRGDKMDINERSLKLPELVHYKELAWRPPKDSDDAPSVVDVYKIDLPNLRNNQRLAYLLPPDLFEVVGESLFAIPSYPKMVFNDLLVKGADYFDNPFYQDFDTMMRDTLREPGVMFVYIACRLLTDYLYDDGWWSRDYSNKRMLPGLMAYTIWYGQTGRGMQWSHSYMTELEHRCLWDIEHVPGAYADEGYVNKRINEANYVLKALDSIRSYEKEQEPEEKALKVT